MYATFWLEASTLGRVLPAVTFLGFGLESKLSDSQLSKCCVSGAGFQPEREVGHPVRGHAWPLAPGYSGAGFQPEAEPVRRLVDKSPYRK